MTVVIPKGTQIHDDKGELVTTIARDITADRRHTPIESEDFSPPIVKGAILHPAIYRLIHTAFNA